MLVLSRHRDEQIVVSALTPAGIPVEVILTVVDIRGDKVRLGIEAPRDVPVHRREVFEAIRREVATKARQEPAALTSPSPQP